MENALDSASHTFAAARLTPRERDCLGLLSRGLLAAEVRTELGISQSTLDAHLASARRKLDARTTLQAVLRFAENGRPETAENTPLWDTGTQEWGELSEAQVGLVDALAHCQSFTQAWSALQHYLANYEIFTVNFGVIAEPAGLFDGSNVSFWSAAADELQSLYNDTEAAKADPVAQHIATSTKPRLFEGETHAQWLRSEVGHVPRVLEYMLDYGQGGAVCVPARDSLTGAVFGMNLPLAIKHQREIRRVASAYTSEFQQSLNLFWHVLQHKRLLANRPGLAPREQEALQFIARGFAVAEMAERVHLSQRAAEQFLSGARAKLGARNNAQAIYRAMVYRALQ